MEKSYELARINITNDLLNTKKYVFAQLFEVVLIDNFVTIRKTIDTH